MLEDPLPYLRGQFDLGFQLTREELDAIHLHALQTLFQSQRDRVPVLHRLATQHHVARLRRLEDVIPLLLPHTVFKSYPPSLLNDGRFGLLTRWLAMLTSQDLSSLDCSCIRSVDEWLEFLDSTTDLRIVHSFAAPGKLSFIPRTHAEWEYGALFLARCIREWHGVDTCHEFYAMTELIPACPRCSIGNYHVPPVLVPFLLHPITGRALPRTGRQTGRFAAVDLLARTYWCGLMSGDEVTLAGWDQPCECGRTGPYVEPTIRRYPAEEGRDDRINSGDTASAHEVALEYVAANVH
jgi:hypothetical protein